MEGKVGGNIQRVMVETGKYWLTWCFFLQFYLPYWLSPATHFKCVSLFTEATDNWYRMKQYRYNINRVVSTPIKIHFSTKDWMWSWGVYKQIYHISVFSVFNSNIDSLDSLTLITAICFSSTFPLCLFIFSVSNRSDESHSCLFGSIYSKTTIRRPVSFCQYSKNKLKNPDTNRNSM